MLVILFKIWCTCLVLTIPAVILNDFPKRPGLMFDMVTTITMAAFAVVDVLLLFVLLIMAIWS
jgi:hypothetical protein